MTDARRQGHVRVWVNDDTFSGYPEQVGAGRPATGICFSGGSTRSFAATIGQIRGLTALGLMPHIGYLSAVSGGAWAAAAYTFYTGSGETDADILGPRREPDAIDDAALGRLDPACLGHAATLSGGAWAAAASGGRPTRTFWDRDASPTRSMTAPGRPQRTPSTPVRGRPTRTFWDRDASPTRSMTRRSGDLTRPVGGRARGDRPRRDARFSRHARQRGAPSPRGRSGCAARPGLDAGGASGRRSSVPMGSSTRRGRPASRSMRRPAMRSRRAIRALALRGTTRCRRSGPAHRGPTSSCTRP